MRALVVDDEPGIRQMLTAVMVRLGWEVQTAATGEEALELFAGAAFDALLIDKNLPGIDGVELIRQVRARDQRAVCVMITGYGNTESAKQTLNLDIDAYVRKPVDNVLALGDQIVALVAARSERAPPRSSTLDALIVSEQPDLCAQMTQLLAGTGLPAVETLHPGPTAVQTIATRAPRLLVLDATQDAGAAHILRALNARPPTPAYAVLTGAETRLTDVMGFIDLGVKALVETPIHRKQFTAAMANVLDALL